jgi:hypothetical protein
MANNGISGPPTLDDAEAHQLRFEGEMMANLAIVVPPAVVRCRVVYLSI